MIFVYDSFRLYVSENEHYHECDINLLSFKR